MSNFDANRTTARPATQGGEGPRAGSTAADTAADFLRIKGYRSLVARNGTQGLRLAMKEKPAALRAHLGRPGSAS